MSAASAAVDAPRAPAGGPADGAMQELGLDTEDFRRVRELIRRRAGISLHAGKRAMVYGRLSRRLREKGFASFGSYLQWLEGRHAADAEWQEFVNCLTTNLTSFFREAHHFAALAGALRQHNGQSLRLWCSAASTGEEAYSIAITASEALTHGRTFGIVASDIDTRVLDSARRAIYPADARGLSAERLRRHFLRGTGANSGAIRVRPELARTVGFCHHNLLDPHPPAGAPFDFVFCRNVMIYFDAAIQRRVLQHIHAAMQPHGLLFAGHSENLGASRDMFRPRGRTVYERV